MVLLLIIIDFYIIKGNTDIMLSVQRDMISYMNEEVRGIIS